MICRHSKIKRKGGEVDDGNGSSCDADGGERDGDIPIYLENPK